MASDFSGSAIVRVSIASHFRHSNVRCSDPSRNGEMRASIIRAWQRPQRGRSIEVKETGVKATSDGLGIITLSCISPLDLIGHTFLFAAHTKPLIVQIPQNADTTFADR